VTRFGRRQDPPAEADEAVASRAGAPTIVAELGDGPLEGRRVEAEVVEGRPPKTIEVEADDGGTCRYCLAEWNQAGASAKYSFLYRV
jgi:hypothetical protein